MSEMFDRFIMKCCHISGTSCAVVMKKNITIWSESGRNPHCYNGVPNTTQLWSNKTWHEELTYTSFWMHRKLKTIGHRQPKINRKWMHIAKAKSNVTLTIEWRKLVHKFNGAQHFWKVNSLIRSRMTAHLFKSRNFEHKR